MYPCNYKGTLLYQQYRDKLPQHYELLCEKERTNIARWVLFQMAVVFDSTLN